MEQKISEEANRWANNSYFDNDFRDEIKKLISEGNEKELVDRFYKGLEFGTGGLRGIIGAGSNRMNVYTVRKASQGLADYINSMGDRVKGSGIAIAYDSRRFSEKFAQESAAVFAANGIPVYLFPELRPVPMLSFAVRELKAVAGIMITASHNPPEYNGYKVYWEDGCQVTPPHDVGIINQFQAIEEFSAINTIPFEDGVAAKKIEYISKSVEEDYFQQVVALSLAEMESNENFNVVYTPLHGTGAYPVTELLRRRGFKKLSVVAEQEKPDENFSTVKSPNPEEGGAFDIALSQVTEEDQLILATDPDADRIGAMVKHQGEWVRLNGNQIGQLILFYYLSKSQDKGVLPSDGFYITTIVTSELGQKIANHFGVKTRETLTGFKYIGSIIRELEEEQSGTFVFGTEESHGYLLGDFVRDKDGVSACMIFAEMAADLKQKGKTVMDQLEEIHQKHGYHLDTLINKVIKGQEGAIKINEIMSTIRSHPFKEIGGGAVKEIRDYLQDAVFDARSGDKIRSMGQLKSNVLAFIMEDGSRITVRPSGTEPKIKFYFNLCGEDPKRLSRIKESYESDFLSKIEMI